MIFFESKSDRYYKMSDEGLEREASKWKIKGYGDTNGIVNRQIIIDALLKKDQANQARLAVVISCLALIVSIVSLIK